MSLKDKYIYPAIFNFADDGISIEFPDLKTNLGVELDHIKKR
jgi:hypothetical protein